MSKKKYRTNILQENQRANLSILTWALECGSRTTTDHYPNPKLLLVLADLFQENPPGAKSREVAQTLTIDFLWIPVLFTLLIEC
ncbi:hypothetical protein ACOSQ2_005708 [Xanthoceras sorbifolium]